MGVMVIKNKSAVIYLSVVSFLLFVLMLSDFLLYVDLDNQEEDAGLYFMELK